MANKLILEGNFEEKIHTLKDGCDAFGNSVEPPEGYYLLKNNFEQHDIIQEGDLHFDIYSGWVDGHSDYYNGRYVSGEGRWRAFARKIKQL